MLLGTKCFPYCHDGKSSRLLLSAAFGHLPFSFTIWAYLKCLFLQHLFCWILLPRHLGNTSHSKKDKQASRLTSLFQCFRKRQKSLSTALLTTKKNTLEITVATCRLGSLEMCESFPSISGKYSWSYTKGNSTSAGFSFTKAEKDTLFRTCGLGRALTPRWGEGSQHTNSAATVAWGETKIQGSEKRG